MRNYTNKCTLNAEIISQLKPKRRNGKMVQRLVWDDVLQGFGVCVGTKSKTFVVQKDVAGRARRVNVGRVDAFSVKEARKRARAIIVQMESGIDPNLVKRMEKIKGITLREAQEIKIATSEKKGRSPATIHGYETFPKRHLSDWLDRPLASITRAEVRQRHERIARTINNKSHRYDGKVAADLTMRCFRAIYNRARREHEGLPECPTINVDWFGQQHDDNKEKLNKVIPNNVLAQWYKLVMDLDNPISRDLLRMGLFTGLRRKNLQEMKWEDIDFDKKLLYVPKPKSRRPFYLPLTDFLLDILRQRKKENAEFFPKSIWVFPSPRSKSGHVEEPRLRVNRVPFYTLHSLRHTYATIAAQIGISKEQIKLLLNHAIASGDITEIYIERDAEDLREAMVLITERLLALCIPSTDNVVELPVKKAEVK